MRDRAIRLSRDRRDRLWRWRSGLGMMASRRMRFTLGVATFAVLGIFLPFHYMLRAPDEVANLSPEARTVKNLQVLRTALACFRRDCGRYPTPAEGLKALYLPPRLAGWKGPYIAALKPDPWRHDYQYACSNETVTLFSAGPDGLAGTADDIAAPLPDEAYVQATATNAPAYQVLETHEAVEILTRAPDSGAH